MTKSCWKQDPNERPTVDYVLDTLRNATERLRSKRGELSTPSPRDDWSLTPPTEGPDSPTVPEDENAPVTTTTPLSRKVPQAPVIKTPVPAPVQARPPHSVLSRPFYPEDGAPPKPIPATSKEEEISSTSVSAKSSARPD